MWLFLPSFTVHSSEIELLLVISLRESWMTLKLKTHLEDFLHSIIIVEVSSLSPISGREGRQGGVIVLQTSLGDLSQSLCPWERKGREVCLWSGKRRGVAYWLGQGKEGLVSPSREGQESSHSWCRCSVCPAERSPTPLTTCWVISPKLTAAPTYFTYKSWQSGVLF